MADGALEAVRRAYAEKVRRLAGHSSAALVRAFAAVPRERFVGPGPWQTLAIDDLARGYRTTRDDDPRHLYDNVLVAIDASRWLNNGEPAALARWLAALELGPGLRFLHVGCGTGYYTAIAAEMVGQEGRVTAVEIDPDLAPEARRNLAPWAWVEVAQADGSRQAGEPGDVDAILVNAGATEVLPGWLGRLRDGGRMVVPLTVASPVAGSGFGGMLLVVRQADGYAARLLSPVAVFHCAGARSEAGESRLREALERGGFEDVRRLRMDAHDRDDACWLHGAETCLSRGAPAGGDAPRELVARFLAYAEDFERTFADDDWSRLEPYFAEDAVYSTPTNGFRVAGRDAVLAALRAAVSGFDRRCDTRRLETTVGPTQRGCEVRREWEASFTLAGAPDFQLGGFERAVYRGDRLELLEVVVPADALARLVAYATAHLVRGGSPPA